MARGAGCDAQLRNYFAKKNQVCALNNFNYQ